ncbi:hypothetical protein [Phormidium sp. CCY1219]|uniref:hypothetical protein n=1 Tax=Phormidium sp. CCY1219 TaxID=2886104 RepID=UPI002D1F1070|nr:hypothetical protein [Phormidium sp. CCY1219]MEB3830189.1 hypothetical protein [Phormidium sp. CCY1219]
MEESFSHLKSRLSEATKAFQDSEIPLSQELIAALATSRNQFEELRANVLKEIKSSGGSPVPGANEIVSLRELHSLLEQAVARANQQKAEVETIRQSALSVLERVLAIDYSENDFSPLRECQEQARELQRIISKQETNLPTEAETLASGIHPLAALLRLISQRDSPNYKLVEELQSKVAQSFGMPLAIAALTGKLILASQSESIPKENKPVDTNVQTQKSTQAPKSKTDNSPESTVVVQITHEAEEWPPVKQSSSQAPPLPSPQTHSEVTDKQLTDVQEIAASILNSNVAENALALHYLIWQLLREDQLSLAFHLGRCLENQFRELQPRLPSWLIRGVALGRHVRYDLGVGEIANILMEDFANFSDRYFIENEGEWNQSLSLLLAASALRPALLAPNTNASNILNYLRLGEGLNQLFEYCQTIANYGNQRCALNTAAIKKVRNQKAWESDMKSLRQEVEEWWSQAPLLDMIYGLAKAVWKTWLKPEGRVYSLLIPIRDNDANQLETVKGAVKLLSSESQIDAEVKRTQKNLNAASRGASIVTGKALSRIHLHVKDAVDFARRWIELQESRTDIENDFSQKQAQQIKQDLSSRHDAVLEELESFVAKQNSLSVIAGISCCQKAVKDIRTLFDPTAPLPTGEPKLKYLLNAELLKIKSLPLDDDWEVEVPIDYSLLDKILRLIAQSYSDWRQSFENQTDSRNHEATERIIEYLQNYPEASINIDELEEVRIESLKECRDSLKRDAKETKSQIEGAVAFGILQEADRAKYAAKIVEIENNFDEILRFDRSHNQLDRIKSSIQDQKTIAIEHVRNRLEYLSISEKHPNARRISELLDKGDVLTANEYIDMVNRGNELPETKLETDTFSDFFPKKAIEIGEFMEDIPGPGIAIKKVRDRDRFCNIDLRRPTGAQTERAAEMLEAWFNAKRVGTGRNSQPTIDENDARTILESLGFNPVKIEVTPSLGKTCLIHLTTKVIRDQELCPVYTYGSAANGQYRILCVWGRPTAEDIINDVGKTTHGSPAFVFFFGRLTERWRRELARTCRERRRTFVLIDDILMLYLCGETGLRLPTLFQCALPFTFLEPYTTTAGLVPPEIFYGRKQERDSIIDPMDSCFIYGGRQLGKTALLRSVEREVHAPEEGRIAYWLDLKAAGIGIQRSIEYLWSLLADVFKNLGVVPSTTPSNAGAETLLQHITNWLEQDKNRRILLLLDEADKFLELDGAEMAKTNRGKGGFIQTSYLKGLMDRTERRFKVVFAGLHNVQRTTRLENQPLAHYGTPICIGPLLDNGEWREARNLIKQPFASIGYELSDDLVTRILSQTNYYPSLIQLYCQELLRDVNKNHLRKFNPNTTPPYQITESQVDEAYQSQNLRKAIRDRFMWTLQLDQRYEVIAYIIAYESLESNQGMVEGFSVSWLRDAVLDWWPAGFQDKKTDEIRALLEEMVGLGVLRESRDDYYALRSPNVVLLLGTKKQIEEELLKEREAPPEFKLGTFRSALPNDISRRSPLTVQQESILRQRKNDVSIIFGSSALGLEEMNDFLVSAVGSEFFIPLEKISNLKSFTKHLEDIKNNRPREVEGTNIVLVSADCEWNKEWVDTALKRVRKLTSKKSFVRICFMANPRKTWELFSQPNREIESIVSKGIIINPWHDDALRQWLEDGNFTARDKESRAKITEVTGNWPLLLKHFYQKCQADLTSWEHHLKTVENSLNDADSARYIRELMGLEDVGTEIQHALSVLKTLEEASAEDLIGIEEGISEDIVRQTLEWARHLHLVLPKGNGNWRVDPLLARVLTAIEE